MAWELYFRVRTTTGHLLEKMGGENYGPWPNPREGVALLGQRKSEAGKKNTSLATPDLVDEERKKKEKESKVKLKTEQMEKTDSKNGRRKN
jgi:hypothetical protein